MTRVAFIIGHEDTPEAYWRVALPARHLRAPMALAGESGAQETALGAEVVWLHQPTSIAAAELAEKAAAKGRAVVVDLSEDPWSRYEVDASYNEHRLAACERALDAATRVVVTSRALAAVFVGRDVCVLPPVVPLADVVVDPETPPVVGWWSDGRQRGGFDEVAPALLRLLETTEVRIRHLSFPHMTPIAGPRDPETGRGTNVSRLGIWMDSGQGAEQACRHFQRGLAGCVFSLDCYPGGRYRETVSELGILRAAALGVPTLTTRSVAPPGSLAARPGEWASMIQGFLEEPGQRRALSLAARSWAETRSSFAPYVDILEEV